MRPRLFLVNGSCTFLFATRSAPTVFDKIVGHYFSFGQSHDLCGIIMQLGARSVSVMRRLFRLTLQFGKWLSRGSLMSTNTESPNPLHTVVSIGRPHKRADSEECGTHRPEQQTTATSIVDTADQ